MNQNQTQNPLDAVITAAEAAELYGVDSSIIRRACKSGAVEARHAGRVWLITRASADARWGKGRQGRQRAPRHHNAVISVADGRAYVARFVPGEKLGNSRTVIASNWEQLEDDAIAAVEAQGGFLTLSGIYQCPREIAMRAQWGDES